MALDARRRRGERSPRGFFGDLCLPRGCEEQLCLAAGKITTLGSGVLIESKPPPCRHPSWLFLRESPGAAAWPRSPPGQGVPQPRLLLQAKAGKSEPRRGVWITPPSSCRSKDPTELVCPQSVHAAAYSPLQPGCRESLLASPAAWRVAQPLERVPSSAGCPGTLTAGRRRGDTGEPRGWLDTR